jgi:PAS domain S-box-containing protein
LRRDTGRDFWGSYNGSAILDDRGRLSHGYITVRDITAQTNAAEALRVSERRFGHFFHSEMIGALCWDVDGGIVDANDKFLRMVGYTRRDLVTGQLNWVAMTPPEHRLLDETALAQLSSAGVTTPYEKEFVRRDGSRIPVLVGAAISTEDRREGIAFILDITDRKRAAAEAGRLSAIVDSSFDAIIGETLDGYITSWNKAAETIFGYSAKAAIGQPSQLLIPPDRQAEKLRVIADIAYGRFPPTFDTVRLKRGGEAIDVSVTISPIKDLAGNVVGVSKIARDISRQRRAELALRDAEAKSLFAQRLESENLQILEASRLKTQFFANMSHELRTPLGAIVGFADLLQTGDVDADLVTRQRFLGHIRESARHLSRLVNDVLDLSKIDSGSLEFFPEPVDLRNLVAEVTDALYPTILPRRIDLTIEIDPILAGLVFDPARFKQVLYNYLSNAIKFSPDGGRIELRATPEGPTHFRIEVEDKGIGIAAADLPRLFVDFLQLDVGYAKQHQGTGLGLALTRRLVESQGGIAGARSTLGQGSTFFAVLKRVDIGRCIKRQLPAANTPQPSPVY